MATIFRGNGTTGAGCVLLALMVLAMGSACLLAPGCYDPKDVQAFLMKPRMSVSGTEYRVYPPDTIAISSTNVPEINNLTGRIRPDGKLNLPLIGEVFVSGKTPKEIETAIIKAASAFYEEADATVRVMGYNSQNFYVFGQVSRPGPMQWTGRDTFLDAMAKAQPTYLAWPERIIVVRAAQPMTGGYYQAAPNLLGQYRATGVHEPAKGNEPKTVTINLMAMVEDGDASHNILLMPNDVIYVQPNPFARLGLWFRSILYPVQPIIQTLSVPAQISRTADDMP